MLVSASLLIPFEEAGRFVRGGGGVDLTAPQLSGMALGREESCEPTDDCREGLGSVLRW